MTSYSVVIPAFNAERTLAAAIESVLSQTILPANVIVVDDGSTDRTAEIAGTYGPHVAIIQQTNSGPGAATTRGSEAATTPLVACIDADDIWLTKKASCQLAYKPFVRVVGAEIKSVDWRPVASCRRREHKHGHDADALPSAPAQLEPRAGSDAR
jgi:glycosyltransferase involved in cell wall biosynthesis